MSWKSDLKLSDLDARGEIEVTCRRCGVTRYERVGQLLDRNRSARHQHLDEVEQDLRCSLRECGGAVRISLIYDDLTEGFVGGMP